MFLCQLKEIKWSINYPLKLKTKISTICYKHQNFSKFFSIQPLVFEPNIENRYSNRRIKIKAKEKISWNTSPKNPFLKVPTTSTAFRFSPLTETLRQVLFFSSASTSSGHSDRTINFPAPSWNKNHLDQKFAFFQPQQQF